jgi:hypothetical protein
MNKEAENRLLNGSETKDASDMDDVRDALDRSAQPQVVADADASSSKAKGGVLRASPGDPAPVPTLK